jgi:glycosyltransferase involved in cell wall biosynthesis
MKKRLLHIQRDSVLAGCERSGATFLHRAQQFDSTVAVLKDGGPAVAAWESEGARVVCLGAKESRCAQHRTVRQLVSELRPDGVILWTNARVGVLVSACRMGGAPRVVVHVGNPLRLSRRNRLGALGYRLLPHSTEAVLIPVSQHVASSIHGEAVFGCYPLRVVFNAIDVESFKFDPKTPHNGKVTAGMVARLDPIKDHETLLRAWPAVLERFPEATLELAGDGILRSQLEEVVAQTGCQGRVRFLGWVEDVAEVMRRWDIVVHSTTDGEGLGNSMTEAMSLGRPLVATDTGPVREVTRQGRTAVLAAPKDPGSLAKGILSVLLDPEGARHRVEVARAWVEDRFSPEAMVRAYLEELGLG